MSACTPVLVEDQRWVRSDCRNNLLANSKQAEATEQPLLHLSEFSSMIGTSLLCQVPRFYQTLIRPPLLEIRDALKVMCHAVS